MFPGLGVDLAAVGTYRLTVVELSDEPNLRGPVPSSGGREKLFASDMYEVHGRWVEDTTAHGAGACLGLRNELLLIKRRWPEVLLRDAAPIAHAGVVDGAPDNASAKLPDRERLPAAITKTGRDYQTLRFLIRHRR